MATLAELRTRVRSYLDAPSATDSFWTDAELNNWINQAYYFSYMEFVQAFENYFAVVTTYNIVAGTDTYALPAGFDKVRLLERVIDNTCTIPLQEFNRIETSNLLSTYAATNLYLPTYRFLGTNFVLEPMPQVSVTNGLRLEYVPQATPLTLDSDTPNAAYLNQWQELIVLKAVVSAKLKEEMTGGQGTDLGSFQAMLDTWENKVKDAIALRSQSRKYTEPFGLEETSNYYYP